MFKKMLITVIILLVFVFIIFIKFNKTNIQAPVTPVQKELPLPKEVPVELPKPKEEKVLPVEEKIKPAVVPETTIKKKEIEEVFKKYNNAKMPIGNNVTVCSAYGCKTAHKFTFDIRLIEAVNSFFLNVKTPADERKALALALAFIETVVGSKTGTSTDRPSIDASGNGDPSQLDCVDEALNTTSYLMVMYQNKMIKFHTINYPDWKGGLTKWTHYSATMIDETTKVKWAIDAGVGRNGVQPLIIEFSRWYE